MTESHSQRSSNPPVAIESPECPRCRVPMILSRIMPGRLNFDSRMFERVRCDYVEKVLVATGTAATTQPAALLTAHREADAEAMLRGPASRMMD
jgi:hypothetical protein